MTREGGGAAHDLFRAGWRGEDVALADVLAVLDCRLRGAGWRGEGAARRKVGGESLAVWSERSRTGGETVAGAPVSLCGAAFSSP